MKTIQDLKTEFNKNIKTLKKTKAEMKKITGKNSKPKQKAGAKGNEDKVDELGHPMKESDTFFLKYTKERCKHFRIP